MDIEEAEIYITRDGFGRAAIVRRSDGHFCIYTHWLISPELLKSGLFSPGGPTNWLKDNIPIAPLYDEYKHPEIGIYGTLEDARHEIKSRESFLDCIPIKISTD